MYHNETAPKIYKNPKNITIKNKSPIKSWVQKDISPAIMFRSRAASAPIRRPQAWPQQCQSKQRSAGKSAQKKGQTSLRYFIEADILEASKHIINAQHLLFLRTCILK